MPSLATLDVRSADPAAELFVVDHGFELAARGLGTLQADLPSGIYKVKAKHGRASWQRLIVLEGNVAVDVPPIAFGSATPLQDTSRSHETHMMAAFDVSRRPRPAPGGGASLFFMSRWWSAPGNEAGPMPGPFGMIEHASLRTPGGRLVADLVEGCERSEAVRDPWAAQCIAVEPGLYTLRIDLGSIRSERTVTMLAGWQTQVFVLLSPSDPVAPALETSLSDVSILMSRDGFNPWDPSTRVADAARLSLADERSVFGEQLQDLVLGETQGPMLGLYAAELSLLLREKEEEERRRHGPARSPDEARAELQRPIRFDADRFEWLREGARLAFGPTHPDVQSLDWIGNGPAKGRLRSAPMLFRAWRRAIAASHDHPALVPVPLWMRSGRVTPERPFLTWVRPPRGPAARLREAVSLTRAVEARLATRPEATRNAVRGGAEFSRAEREAAEEFVRDVSRDLDLPRAVIELIVRPV